MKCLIGSPSRETRAAVGEIALALLVADRQAEVRALVAAMLALAALRREQRDHVIAGRHVSDALADPLDDAGALVSEHGRRVAGRISARRGVEVGVADAAGDEPDKDFSGLRLGEVELLELEG